MCDFHSIVVRRDGAVAHIPQNSHSGAVEAEWNGQGAFPGVDKIIRDQVNEQQRKKIQNHYTALAKLLAGSVYVRQGATLIAPLLGYPAANPA